MLIVRKYFPEVLSDNEENYFALIQGILESVDELSSLQISKLVSGYQFRLIPSAPRYTDFLIKEINTFHNTIGIRLDFSKSIKTSATIVFKINLDNK